MTGKYTVCIKLRTPWRIVKAQIFRFVCKDETQIGFDVPVDGTDTKQLVCSKSIKVACALREKFLTKQSNGACQLACNKFKSWLHGSRQDHYRSATSFSQRKRSATLLSFPAFGWTVGDGGVVYNDAVMRRAVLCQGFPKPP